MKGQTVYDRDGYRAFRESLLEDHRSRQALDYNSLPYYEEEESHPWQKLRQEITAFREQVRHTLPDLVADDPAIEPYVRRALGIPVSVSLIAERWSRLRYIAQFFVPSPVSWRHIRSVLTRVRTYEGRRYLFDGTFARMLPHDLQWFTRGTDLALRRLQIPTLKELNTLSMLDPDWMQATYHVGLRKLAEIEPLARYGHFKLAGEFARMLVAEKVISTRDEFAWIEYEQDRNDFSSAGDAYLKLKARRLVRVLLDHDIQRKEIAGIFRFHASTFDSRNLDANLTTLRASGSVDLTAVFKEVGDKLWRTPQANWQYILTTLGARTVEDIRRFKRLLDSYRGLPVDFAEGIKRLGAGIQGLAQCQSLILAVSGLDSDHASLAALDLLAAPPHSMNIEQIAQCVDYLSKPEKLPDYLAVLARFGYGSGAAVLAFQVCYQRTAAEDLERWLAIVGNRGKGQAFEIVVEWVRQARQGGHSDAYHYLISAIAMPDLKHLQQALPIAGFGRGILRFLVEERGLRSVQAIRDWYYSARGVQGFRWWGRDDAAYILLLKDAYERNNFSFVTGNQNCIGTVVRERVSARLGRRPLDADDATRQAYDDAYELQCASERTTLLQILPVILQQTGGILLNSAVRSAWEPPNVLNATLTALTPLIDELLSGRGPASAQLDELQADAIAMLYRTSVDAVAAAWPKVIGHEGHLADLTLRSQYTMTWKSAFRRLNTPLERRSLLALAYAAACAKRFERHEYENIFEACKSLRAKRLYQPARDPWSLATHLGVLLAAGHGDSLVAQWVARDLDAVAQMAEDGAQAFERIEQLEKLFSSTLPDALKEHADDFLRQFDDTDAAFFAERLVGREALPDGASGQEQLRHAFRLTSENVLAVCQRWVAREIAKFVPDEAGNQETRLSAVLSKHPATFFAKDAADLCTRGNAAMWQEPRHAHLVVFDRVQRRLAGMALVYIELMPALHASRNCLIIRAINPMDDMLATHTASSIVDAFFEVAIHIAAENGLAAAAFPSHNGVHLLSNHPSIEKDIEKRFIDPSVVLGRRSDAGKADSISQWRAKPRLIEAAFFAYEHGREKVSTQYAFWHGSSQADNTNEETLREIDPGQ